MTLHGFRPLKYCSRPLFTKLDLVPFYALQCETLLHQKTKEQEETLTRETLLIFNDMKIRFPGKTSEETELILEDVSIEAYWVCLIQDLVSHGNLPLFSPPHIEQ